MNRLTFVAALLCCASSCSAAFAADQSAAPPPAAPASTPAAPASPEAAPAPSPPAPAQAPGEASAPAAAATSNIVIPAGTMVVVALVDPLSSSNAHEGDHFGLTLAEPIVIGGVVAAPAGALGQGEVIDAKPAGIGGRPGRLVLAARFVDSGPVRIKLQSLKLGGGGRDHSELAVDATIAIGIVGALVTGGNIDYPAGTRATAKLAAEVTAPLGNAPPVAAAATPSANSTPSP